MRDYRKLEPIQHCLAKSLDERSECLYRLPKSETNHECIYYGTYFKGRCDYDVTSHRNIKAARKQKSIYSAQKEELSEEELLEIEELQIYV